MWRYLRNLTLALLTLLLVAGPLAACGEPEREADDLSARPAAVTTPTGQVCQPWVNNPHEVDDTGIRACDYPIPRDRPVQHDGMSAGDFALLMLLFNNGLGHSDFYYGPGYYGRYIEPAWNRYPGTYRDYGGGSVTRVDNRTYNTTITHVNGTYAADEKRLHADPKYSTYKTSGGKTYTGNTVPKTAFRSTNVPVTSPAGDGGTSRSRSTSTSGGKSTTSGGKSTTSGSKTSTGSSGGKSGWSGSSGSSSRSSGGSSSSSRSGK
jgi:hypothetical protein